MTAPESLFEDALANAKHALKTKASLESFAAVLGVATQNIRQQRRWYDVLELLDRLPDQVFLKWAALALIKARALVGLGDEWRVVAFLDMAVPHFDDAEAAPLRVERSWALLCLKRFDDAKLELKTALPHLSGDALGLAWRRLAWTQQMLGEDGWIDAFEKALRSTSLKRMGFALLDYAKCCYRANQDSEARGHLLKALLHLEHDPHLHSQCRYELGLIQLRHGQFEAREEFELALELALETNDPILIAQTWCGVGAARRAQGDWLRAEAAYLKVMETEHPYWEAEAWCNLGRTYRLASKVKPAMIALERASELTPSSTVQLEQAAAFLQWGSIQEAARLVDQVQQPQGADVHLHWILRAELARKTGTLENCLELLRKLPLDKRIVREEVPQWPELFALLHQCDGISVDPLPMMATVVTIRALGVPEVRINGYCLDLKPTSKSFKLLACLARGRGRARASETLIDELWPDDDIDRKQMRRLSKQVGLLRESLGWNNSVKSVGAAYQLDSAAQWVIDLAEKSVVLEGNYDNWVAQLQSEFELD
jgi:tetratricopeptide (TPR) repeat protein